MCTQIKFINIYIVELFITKTGLNFRIKFSRMILQGH